MILDKGLYHERGFIKGVFSFFKSFIGFHIKIFLGLAGQGNRPKLNIDRGDKILIVQYENKTFKVCQNCTPKLSEAYYKKLKSKNDKCALCDCELEDLEANRISL